MINLPFDPSTRLVIAGTLHGILPSKTVLVLQLSIDTPFPLAFAVAFIICPVANVTAGDKAATLIVQLTPKVVVVPLPRIVLPSLA
ncbi:hypothetical protein D3C85_761660 [compost metagenome]